MSRLFLSLLVILWSLAVPIAAQAQSLPNDDVISIGDRFTNDYMARGIEHRAFVLHPGLEISGEYNDNIFAQSQNEESDFITTISPSFLAISDWDIHRLALFADADIARHADNTNENYEDFNIGLSGRYDVGYDTYFDASLSFQDRHEDRDSPNDVGGDEPTEFDVLTAELGFTRELGRLQLFIETRIRDIEFEDSTLGNTVIDNSFRSRTEKTGDLKLAYEFIPNYDIFIRGVVDERDYELSTPIDRTSIGARIEAGTSLDISGKIKGEIYGGYITRDYRDGFEDVNTEDYGASLVWNVSGITSLTADLDRRVVETIGAGISSFIRTTSTLSLEHAFDESLMGAAQARYLDDNFVGSTRDDETLNLSLDLNYTPARGTQAGLRYDYTTRNSDLATANFNNHRVTARVGYTF